MAQLALDTGATKTVLNWNPLIAVGYDPAATIERTEITTGSGIEYAPRLTIDKLSAMGHERTTFPLLCHSLPPSAGVDGLLGLDFLVGHRLLVDFQQGFATLE